MTGVSAVCFCHIRRLRQIRRRVGQAVTTRLVLAMNMSRLDYCNSVLQSTLEPLQKVPSREIQDGVNAWRSTFG